LKEGADGEESEEDFEDGAAGIVLVRRFDIACDDMGTGYLEEGGLCLYEGIREKGEEGLEGGR
jgi:hypothetical protein